MIDINKCKENLTAISKLLGSDEDVEHRADLIAGSDDFANLVVDLSSLPLADKDFETQLANNGLLEAVPVFRRLRSYLTQPTRFMIGGLRELSNILMPEHSEGISSLAAQICGHKIGEKPLLQPLEGGQHHDRFKAFAEELEEANPHSLYPTSPYRESEGDVVSSADDHKVEAVMTQRTFTSIRIEDDLFNIENPSINEIYQPLGRCICLIDSNVDEHFGEMITRYFDTHGIQLFKLSYRAMEVDKSLSTVERIVRDFKDHSVARNEPVLMIGGGVLADIGGLACALFNRNTPYVMIGTSIVSGIDAGPSPRTCCDGFGYKNLLGAYHAPILTFLDRSFFQTMKTGWLRHGVVEIIKMAVIKDKNLFEMLESAGPALFHSKFGTNQEAQGTQIETLSKKILAAAMRSYVEAEYGNLYETHQCRPHAYGHTWSPGFELQAGLLHGHAVSIGMGFGAYLSKRVGWLDELSLQRILSLISKFELSLWHDVLLDEDLIWSAQCSVTTKRGGNLAAPLPKINIGSCGYLNKLSREELVAALNEYRKVCEAFDRGGLGIEPLCSDVGLEDPSVVGNSFSSTVAAQ